MSSLFCVYKERTKIKIYLMQIKIDEKWKDIYTYIQIINHFSDIFSLYVRRKCTEQEAADGQH